jgi:hypothetical protein
MVPQKKKLPMHTGEHGQARIKAPKRQEIKKTPKK